MKNTTNSITVKIWLAALALYAVTAWCFWEFDFLRLSRFSVAEAKKQAAEQKAKRDKARRGAKPKKPRDIPPRELQRIGERLAKKRAKNIKKRLEKVDDVTEKLLELGDELKKEYEKSRSAEEETYARIAAIAFSMERTTKQLGLPVCEKLRRYTAEVNKRHKEDGFDVKRHLKWIAEENSKVLPYFQRVKDPVSRGRLVWQSKELARLLAAAGKEEFEAARTLGGEESEKPAAMPEAADTDPQAIADFMENAASRLDAAFEETKSLEEAVANNLALDAVLGDEALDQRASKEIAQAFLDDAQQEVPPAEQTAKAVPGAVAAQQAAAAARQELESAQKAMQQGNYTGAQAAANRAIQNAQNALQSAQDARNGVGQAGQQANSQNGQPGGPQGGQPGGPQNGQPGGPQGGQPGGPQGGQGGPQNAAPGTREELKQYSDQYRALDSKAVSLVARAGSLARQANIGNAVPNAAAVPAARLNAAMSQRRAIAAAVSSAGGSGKMQLDLSGALRAVGDGSGFGASSSGGGSGDGAGVHVYNEGDIVGSAGIPPKKAVSAFDSNRIKQQSLPGRRLYPNAKRKGWLFVDSWYVIGPWDATRVKSKDLPSQEPERRIDLDAEYEGKRDSVTGKPMKLRWRYLQTDTVSVRPYDQLGNSYYYAYTEIWCAAGMDVTFLVGSDDAAKIWLNGITVWEDSGLSDWGLAEGVVKVYLKKGYNKLLVRIHNGPGECEFSLTMAPSADLKKKQ